MAAPYRISHVFRQIHVSLRQNGIIKRRLFPSSSSGCSQCRHNSQSQEEFTPQPSHSLASQFREAAEAQLGSTSSKISLCRTSEKTPGNHSDHHVGLYYNIPQQDVARWLFNTFRVDYMTLCKSFHETCVMVRKPAVEVMQYLKQTDYNDPVIRYVLYGHLGNGKTHSLGHIMHYCALQGWFILHVRFGSQFSIYKNNELQPSTYKEGRLDQPVESTEWLAYIKHINEPLFKSLELTCQNRYVWSKRETVEIGEPLLQAIDFGLARPRYASDVMGMLMKELRIAASRGKLKLLCAFDGVNGFWAPTKYRKEDNNRVDISELTTVHNLKKMLKNDWNGGAAVLTVDETCNTEDQRQSYFPKYLLGREGFEHLDPHIPIHVPTYSDKEFHSCINYYLDRKWIQNPLGQTEEGRKELRFLSSKNPHALYEATRNW